MLRQLLKLLLDKSKLDTQGEGAFRVFRDLGVGVTSQLTAFQDLFNLPPTCTSLCPNERKVKKILSHSQKWCEGMS